MGASTNPSLASVVRVRYWAVAAARIVCAVWLIWDGQSSVIQLVNEILTYAAQVGRPQPLNTFAIQMAIAPLILPSVALFFSRWVILRLLPLPRPACPACGYAITNAEAPRCPECGLQLGS